MNDSANAIRFFRIQNFAWSIWAFLYIAIMTWFWIRFINIVWDNIDETNQHQTQSPELQNKLDQLRRGSRNVNMHTGLLSLFVHHSFKFILI